MLAIYVTIILVCLSSIVLGQAILRICGYASDTNLAPALGFSALIVLSSAVFWLPGHRVTGGIIVAIVSLLAGAYAIQSGCRPRAAPVITALITLGAVSVPFFVNRHSGIIGVSIDDDFAAHLTWASSLYTPSIDAAVYPYYPLGPHVLAASMAGLLGTTLEPTFMGVLMAIPILAALTARAALARMTALAQVIGGVLVGIPYLVASYLAEGNFKELMMGLILLGFALTLRQLSRDRDWRDRRAVVLGIMVAASMLIDGRVGAVWPLAAASLWVVAELLSAKRMPSWTTTRQAIGFIAIGVLAAFVASLSEFLRLLHFSGNVPGGNVTSYISPSEVLGIWFSGDFRNSPVNVFGAGLFVGLALMVAVYAAVWWIRRRDFAVPAAAASSLILYIGVRQDTGPYLTAKALAMVAAPVMLYLVAPLVSVWNRDIRSDIGRLAVGLVALVFVVGALWSSGFALRYARVNSDERANELVSIAPLTHGEPTLYLAEDDFAFWELRGARLSSPLEYGAASETPFEMRKANAIGAAVDVDSIVPGTLDRFRYLVTTTSQFASEVPANWRLVAATRNFELWRRSGSTVPRSILAEGNAPGALLDCGTSLGRRIQQSSDVAGVWDTAPVGPAFSWSIGATALPANAQGFVTALTGSTLTQNLSLPPGRWEISLAYQSPAHLYLTMGNLRAVIPSDLANIGPFWRVGDVTSTGAPMTATLKLQPMRLDLAEQSAAVGGLAAVSLPRRIDIVPIVRACGRYVDWYAR
ncbi:MAG TPA: hypothetical protein VIJ50_12240 [Solirubrobacteraceae bacterium]